jgi:hypothetical protein
MFQTAGAALYGVTMTPIKTERLGNEILTFFPISQLPEKLLDWFEKNFKPVPTAIRVKR